MVPSPHGNRLVPVSYRLAADWVKHGRSCEAGPAWRPPRSYGSLGESRLLRRSRANSCVTVTLRLAPPEAACPLRSGPWGMRHARDGDPHRLERSGTEYPPPRRLCVGHPPLGRLRDPLAAEVGGAR